MYEVVRYVFRPLQLDFMVDKVGYPNYLTKKKYRDEFYKDVSNSMDQGRDNYPSFQDGGQKALLQHKSIIRQNNQNKHCFT